ncbi:hypothetical protein LTR53_012663 [Teratosphaeriaceae sp. CCFEE 6253]|nr:hypothetical protein LTR53_012663 [Teratosphaeriaceae sp. CCFEE 6253]
MPFDTVPSKASLKPSPFKAETPDKELQDFKQLVQLGRIGPKTYENQVADVKDFTSFGITRKWLEDAKQEWEKTYDWRKTEARINALPNYTVEIEDEGFKFNIHFAALFSKKADAVPLLLSHGWPGSFLEFLGVLEELSSKYDEDSLPYHVIVPSLPGYCYSNGPPLDRDFTVQDIAKVLDKLMLGLGFGDGYVAQGGDIGSFVTRVLAVTSSACKAAHINLCIGVMPESEEQRKGLNEKEERCVRRHEDFGNLGSAYAREHGTRPSTIGLVLASNPVALLAWIGEKFLQWSDESPPVSEILDDVTLWWLTESFARSIYPYRQFFGAEPTFFHDDSAWYIKKPMGYSWHPQELAPVPVKLVKRTGNLVWHREHESGGHFAAMEQPKQFVKDIEDFIAQVWSEAKAS